ncbi:hypothetical protein OEG86_18815 [Hoeflea alexandrii]|uniref:hypothetical protein n=1 Tax=Hoeflea alexandrii TaxID=288436 RepID=UPI0022718C8C|nr:hypothetical protein [Hoeflea alexandrii]MCY0153936.1 hypothetical protein [Hoeflea alexandrii]
MLINQIARSTQLQETELLRLAQNASRHYKLYDIPKRNGEPRRIAHPSRELKAIQRWIVKVIIQRLPIHDAATAYRKGEASELMLNVIVSHFTRTDTTLRIFFHHSGEIMYRHLFNQKVRKLVLFSMKKT